MQKDFDEMLKNLEREVLELKSAAVRASTQIGTYTVDIPLTFTFRKTTDYQGRTIAVGNEKYSINLNTDDEIAIACCSFVEMPNGRSYDCMTRLNSSDGYEFFVQILRGNSADIAGAGQPGTLPITIHVSITCTSVFEYNIITG